MTAKHSAQKVGEDSIKETIESIVIAFILAFVFRAYVVEAFVIPTGSMAPTLLGRHVRVVCPQCGYQYATDTPRGHDAVSSLQRGGMHVSCPMCHYPNPLPGGTRISAGDRILVQKYIYSLSEPRRWDVLVFKAPHVPDTNYIKRLVGLPNERLWIIEGNIYVQPIDEETNPSWGVARKPASVQRAVWQPIYHSRYEPLDQGTLSAGRATYPWHQPWVADDRRAWQLGGGRFRYSGTGRGVIGFDFGRAVEGGPGLYGYNQLKHRALPFMPIEDVRVAVTVLADQPGLFLRLHTTARLDDSDGQAMQLIGQIDAQGNASLQARNPATGQARVLGQAMEVGPFTPGKATAVELWYVDQEASLWVDGQRVQVWPFDLPIEAVKTRRGPSAIPKIAIEVGGAAATLNRVEVDRDLYYMGLNPSGAPARGALLKNERGHRGQPVELHANQFFCCGDNSPLSQDSRFWTDVNPWVKKRLFPNNADVEDTLGIVPRELIMGKAFFVYFPTPLRIGASSPSWIPNFGDMRFIY